MAQSASDGSLIVPTSEDWSREWPTILRLFTQGTDGRGMSYAKLASAMRYHCKWNATPKMFFDRIALRAGLKRYLSADERNRLAAQIIAEYEQSQTPPAIDLDTLQKIIRHHPKSSPEAKRSLETLKAIKASLSAAATAGNGTSTAMEIASAILTQETWLPDVTFADDLPIEDDDDFAPADLDFELIETQEQEQQQLMRLDDFQDLAIGLEGAQHPRGSFTTATADLQQDNPQPATSRSQTLLPTVVNSFDMLGSSSRITTATHPDPLNHHLAPGGHAHDLERLIHHTQSFYGAQLRLTRSSSAGVAGTSNTSNAPNNNAAAASKAFWTNLKNAIYFFKDPNWSTHPAGLARTTQMLQRAGTTIDDVVCPSSPSPSPPLSLLRELLTTLSLSNTAIQYQLRTILLTLFARKFRHASSGAATAAAVSSPNQELSTICTLLLLTDALTDHDIALLHRVLLRLAKEVLDPRDLEIVELHRAGVQLARRMGELDDADTFADAAVMEVEGVHGRDSEAVRMLLSERVYVLSARDRPEEALELAREVVERGKRFDGAAAFPSKRSVYHLEDVAEILRRLGRFEEAREYLEEAVRGAFSLGGGGGDGGTGTGTGKGIGTGMGIGTGAGGGMQVEHVEHLVRGLERVQNMAEAQAQVEVRVS